MKYKEIGNMGTEAADETDYIYCFLMCLIKKMLMIFYKLTQDLRTLSGGHIKSHFPSGEFLLIKIYYRIVYTKSIQISINKL